MSENNRPGAAARLVFGLLFVLAGLMPMLGAYGIGPLAGTQVNGPPWLGALAGGLFVVAGLAVMADRLPPLVSSVLGVVLLAGFAAIGNWIAFGAGERYCSASFPVPLLWTEYDLSALGCRIPFGIGALIINGILLYATARTLQQALGGPPRLARLVRMGEWLLMVGLAPILVPMVLFLILRGGGVAILTRLRTGAWPRNEDFIGRQRKRRERDSEP